MVSIISAGMPKKLTAEEQREQREYIKAFGDITQPSQAPVGSELRTLADAAKAAGDERDDLTQRVASLRERLDGVKQREAASMSLDDYATAATCRAEVIVVSERLSETEARLAPATKAAETAEGDLSHIWNNARRCIQLLEQQARTGFGGPRDAGEERAKACRRCLSALLTVGSPKEPGWWTRSR
jgi:hypothetical protein